MTAQTSELACCACGATASMVALYRQNEKGAKGIWACEQHDHVGISKDSDVKAIADALKGDSNGKN